MKKYILLLAIMLVISPFNCDFCVFAADWMRTGNADLTLENEPKVGEIAIIKIKVTSYTDIPNGAVSKAKIYCGIPDGLELIKDKDYLVERKRSVSDDYFDFVTLYEGPVKKGETKELIFKVRIPDTKKYVIFGGITGSGDQELEINLGEPEPPELASENKEIAGANEEKPLIMSSIRQLASGKLSNLEFSENSLPPLRTEIRVRTKNKPYIIPPYNPKEIPLRYLIYTEGETKETNVIVELPEGLELINDQNYEVTTEVKEGKKITVVKLFQGPTQLKECNAFYFKVRSDKEEHFKIRVEAKVLTYENREFVKEDFQDIELGKALY